ncbi:hypothetical protein B0H13DRAFT_2318307 [Mycena leptocephala]|nr:hypothetical protein B0H13DRAFT_2318307 [Mycena leptocephala]
MAQMDGGMGRDAEQHKRQGGVEGREHRWCVLSIVFPFCLLLAFPIPKTYMLIDTSTTPENFLLKIDGSGITLAHVLQHLTTSNIQVMLLGPESGMREYAGARLFGTFGVPLRVYSGLKIKLTYFQASFPAFLRALRSSGLHVIHLVNPIWLGVQALVALQIVFPNTPIVMSHHTNLPTYAEVWGTPTFTTGLDGSTCICTLSRGERLPLSIPLPLISTSLHSNIPYILVPTPSTARLLWGELAGDGDGRGWAGVLRPHPSASPGAPPPPPTSSSSRSAAEPGEEPGYTRLGGVFELFFEWSTARRAQAFTGLMRVFGACVHSAGAWRVPAFGLSGAGAIQYTRHPLKHQARLRRRRPYLSMLQRLYAQLGVDAILMGQLTGRGLGEAVGSADVMRWVFHLGFTLFGGNE